MAAVMRVYAIGMIAFTLMFVCSWSCARLRLNANTPPLADGVVAAAGRAEHRARRGVHDAPVVALEEVRPRRAQHVDGPDQVRRVHQLVRLRLGEVAAARDPGVVDDDVDAAPRVERLRDERVGTFACRDAVGVGDRGAAGVGDLGDDGIRHVAIAVARARRAARRGR